MTAYGYARVSAADQSLEIQQDALRKAGCEIIRSEKRTGTTRQGREELEILLTFVRPGDEIVVTRIDRLARSVMDLQTIVATLRAKGVTLRATEQPVDMATPAGKAFLDMLGVFAEFETALRRERQMEGIARAKAEGKYVGKGRKATIDGNAIRAMSADGVAASDLARKLGINRSSVYRALAAEVPADVLEDLPDWRA